MAQLIKINISLDGGKKIDQCLSLVIRQELFTHHSFEIKVPFEALEEKGESSFKSSHKDICGKTITISFEPVLEKGSFDFLFKGIVTSITLSNTDDLSNVFIIAGFSPTILLEDGQCRRIFLDKNLEHIFRAAFSVYPGNILKTSLHPHHTDPIKYSVQYDESNFSFLNRLAASYGEWFFYNGQELVLGPPPNGKEAQFGINGTQTFDLSVSLSPARLHLSGYDYSKDRNYASVKTTELVDGLDHLGRFALNGSDNLFGQDAQQVADRPVYSQQELGDLAKTKRSRIAGNMVVFNGHGESPDFTIGEVINVSIARLGKSRDDRDDLGKYRVIGITHTVDGNGSYTNQFKAVPDSIKIPPANPFAQQPAARSELATVTDHNDPDKMNRVRVQFQWPGQDNQSDWIRPGTFYSGGEQGGIQFLPEKGAQVLIGYESGDPQRPFVLTSFYPKKGGMPTVKGNNDQKLIHTRGGNLIEFTDKKNDNSIRITHIDKEDTSLLIQFNNEGKISIQTNGKIEITAGGDLSLTAKKGITLDAQNIKITAQGGEVAINGSIVKIN